MIQTTTVLNTENDDNLFCPITLELFRDPVIAKDGHVYEREAITKWILQHGTSPFTRETLQITDLLPDDHLKRLAAARRNSVVSYQVRDGTVTLPSLRKLPKNQTHDRNICRALELSRRSHKIFLCIICTCLICVSISLGVSLGVKQTGTSPPPDPQISCNYSSSLTKTSMMFQRPNGDRGVYYYKPIQIFISTPGYYEIQSFSNIDMFGYFYLYFMPLNPPMNILMSDDDSGGNNQFYFRISLDPIMYTLVATTYEKNITGLFSIMVTGPASVTFH
ncbi:unnamed protein product [Adineta steineri]|uniref:U-box domain-containing protein n=1 Tax=Adineta steineri TaxID=433720 RepID=A0A815AKX2_9BILA|nr:unnamed protein product [Adineta steineri]CAF1546593.1 unnamed protein product [Adineta steineri]